MLTVRESSFSAFLTPCVFIPLRLRVPSVIGLCPGRIFKAERKGTRKSYGFVCFAHIVRIVSGCNLASVRYLLLWFSCFITLVENWLQWKSCLWGHNWFGRPECRSFFLNLNAKRVCCVSLSSSSKSCATEGHISAANLVSHFWACCVAVQ